MLRGDISCLGVMFHAERSHTKLEDDGPILIESTPCLEDRHDAGRWNSNDHRCHFMLTFMLRGDKL